MRKVLLFSLACFLVGGVYSQSLTTFINKSDDFFSAYIKEGLVDYKAIKQNKANIDELVKLIQSMDTSALSQVETKAFYINAYNLLVIFGLIEHYPVNSPQGIPGFFDQQKYEIAGERLTLDELEKNKLLATFSDPRLHFILVCGAKGCPPLYSKAYTPNNLESQIETQTRLALGNKDFIQLNRQEKQVGISSIFKWYQQEFENEADNIFAYINRFRTEPISDEFSLIYYPYDWSINEWAPKEDKPSNIQTFTPSILLPKGKFELKLFNNLYTQNAFRDGEGNKVLLGERQTFFTGLYQFTYGVSKSGRLNLGVEIVMNAVRYDTDPSSSAFRILTNPEEGKDFARAVIGYVGPRLRFTPLKNIRNFSVTSTIQIPVSSNMQEPRFLAWDRTNWITQFFYDHMMGDFQIFAEADVIFRFPSTLGNGEEQPYFFRTPVTAFFSYFPNSKSTVNINVQYSPAFGKGVDNFSFLNDFVQIGAGAKYQITKDINLEILYTNFVASQNQGAGQTFNFGVVLIR